MSSLINGSKNKATFPTPDPQFDSTKRDARWEHMKTNVKKGMEQKAARYFDDNFVPNKKPGGELSKVRVKSAGRIVKYFLPNPKNLL